METKKITPEPQRREKSPMVATPHLVRCTQCGDYFELEHLPRRDLAPPLLCVDCAFDDIPHTD